ncbi:MAG: mercury(II) reductase [bacterium]
MSAETSYDLVVLGGGAAAFAAITEAGERGLSAALVNTGLPLGGTCVNVGCVPSKHLLAVAHETFGPPNNPFNAIRYSEEQPDFDWSTALDEKDELVETVRGSNYYDVADYYDADVYEGRRRFVDDTTIEVVEGKDQGTRITGEKSLVATGSSPKIPDIKGLDEIDFLTSESILTRENQPDSVLVVGAGYVGLEWGQILNHLGTDVTIFQRSERVLSKMEGMIGRTVQDIFEDEGVEVVTEAQVSRVGEDGEEEIYAETETNGETRMFTASDLFMATGVKANTKDIGLEEIGIETDEQGAVVIDESMQTSNSNVYGAGDCANTLALETVAAKEGNFTVKNAFGNEHRTINYKAIPKVIYTRPEIASVGVTELEYMDEHGTCSCRTVQLGEVPRALAVKDTRGFLQVVKHHGTDEIMGVHMVSRRAGDIIPEATLAVKHGLTVDDIIDTVHPFPTFSEAFKHACQAFRYNADAMTCCVQ